MLAHGGPTAGFSAHVRVQSIRSGDMTRCASLQLAWSFARSRADAYCSLKIVFEISSVHAVVCAQARSWRVADRPRPRPRRVHRVTLHCENSSPNMPTYDTVKSVRDKDNTVDVPMQVRVQKQAMMEVRCRTVESRHLVQLQQACHLTRRHRRHRRRKGAQAFTRGHSSLGCSRGRAVGRASRR